MCGAITYVAAAIITAVWVVVNIVYAGPDDALPAALTAAFACLFSGCTCLRDVEDKRHCSPLSRCLWACLDRAEKTL